jgi:anti-anti-sigma factor
MVAVVDEVVCVKISGRANFTSSLDFKKLITELAGRGYSRFVLDLSECLMMDSTFLGVLAGIGLEFAAANGNKNSHPVELLNPNDRLRDLLENLGIAHLFKIVQATRPAGEQQFEAVCATDSSRVDVTRNCLEAHRLLMSLNPANVGRFKDCTQFLAEDLRKLEGKTA